MCQLGAGDKVWKSREQEGWGCRLETPDVRWELLWDVPGSELEKQTTWVQ